MTVEQREANWIGNFCAASTDKKASPKRLKKQVGSMSGSLLTINQPNSALKRPQSPYLEVREPPPIIWGGLRREELASSTRNRVRAKNQLVSVQLKIVFYCACI